MLVQIGIAPACKHAAMNLRSESCMDIEYGRRSDSSVSAFTSPSVGCSQCELVG
jgi:hypothetical protein